MSGNRVHSDALFDSTRFGQSNCPHDIRAACLFFLRKAAPFNCLKPDKRNRAAANNIRRASFEKTPRPDEDTDTKWRIILVSKEGKKINMARVIIRQHI